MVFFVVRWLVSRLSVQKVKGSIHGAKTFLESIFIETHSVRVYCVDTINAPQLTTLKGKRRKT